MINSTFVEKDNDIKICVEDIDLTRISYENVRLLQQLYPYEDTETLCRYLVGKKNDLEKTKQQLDRAIVLRKKGYWNIHKAECINEIKYGKCYLNGYDKDGYPLLVITARLHNPTSVLLSDHRCDLHETALMTLWWTEVAISKLSFDKSRITMLIDRSGCDDVPLDKEYIQLMSDIYQDLHPERLHRAIVYPSGFVFYTMWTICLKWFLDSSTRDKIIPALNIQEVELYVDNKQIPCHLGGKCEYVFNPDDFDDPVISINNNNINNNDDDDIAISCNSINDSNKSLHCQDIQCNDNNCSSSYNNNNSVNSNSVNNTSSSCYNNSIAEEEEGCCWIDIESEDDDAYRSYNSSKSNNRNSKNSNNNSSNTYNSRSNSNNNIEKEIILRRRKIDIFNSNNNNPNNTINSNNNSKQQMIQSILADNNVINYSSNNIILLLLVVFLYFIYIYYIL